MNQKLRSSRGETLTETLVAVLIVALSSLILATMTATAARLDHTADESTQQFYGELTAAEECVSDNQFGSGSVVLSGDLAGRPRPLEITYYGTEDGLISYRGAQGAAP